MKKSWAVRATLVVLLIGTAGCGGSSGISGTSSPDQTQIKQAFIRQLVGFCAEVDTRLAKIDMKAQPGMAADQLARFTEQARSQPPPDVDRAQFDTMLNEIDTAVSRFRSAQTALARGDQSAADAALEQANRQMAVADAAAQKYGMPPLNSCPEHVAGTSPSSEPSAAPAPGVAGWRPRHQAAMAVQQVDAAVLDGRVWVAGGLTGNSEATASTQVYDPTINSWEQGPALPEPVHHAMLVTYHNQLMLIGGFLPRDNDILAVTSPRVLMLDNNTGRWVEGPPLHHPRAAGGAAVVGDKVVVVGGRTGDPEQLVTQTEIFDGTRWRDGADIPVPGDHLAATSDSGYLYAVGGRKFTAGSNTDAVQRYDPKTNKWTALAPTPQPVSGAGAAIVDNQLIVAGGEGVTSTSATVQAYDLTAPTATWTPLPSLTQGRHGLGVAAIGNTIYALGGAAKPGHTASTNLVGALVFSS